MTGLQGATRESALAAISGLRGINKKGGSDGKSE